MYECKIGEKLVRLRQDRGVTQDEVAQALSVSNKTISKWETGASMPDIPMLAALSEYFGVATDVLLGLSEDKADSTRETVRAMFAGLGFREAVLKAFETESAIIPAIFRVGRDGHDGHDGGARHDSTDGDAYPASDARFSRSEISMRDIFKFVASSDDVNLSVTLLRNKNNFAWLRDAGKQRKIAKFFRFLADEEALSVFYFVHSTDCHTEFTADYVAAHTGVPEERVSEILKQFCDVGECNSQSAHLVEGEVNFYECYGDGLILAVISLAYERMCGRRVYSYCHHGGCKMIGGAIK